MDQQKVSELEKYLEDQLFRETGNTGYALKRMSVIIKYLIYQQLKELNNNLNLIDEALNIDELKK